MIPLRDANPTRSTPIVTYILIGLNILVFLFQLSLGPHVDRLIFRFGIVPARVTSDIELLDIAVLTWFPFLTSMFLHGGWMHLIGNMLFLHIFGDNVEDRCGRIRFLVFYVLCGIGASVMQIAISPGSEIPMIGASGAIAGVMGAYVFLYPRARIVTLLPLFIFFPLVELPAFLFLGIWFLMQMFSGVMSLGIGADAGGVAWWAHIGGFGAGAILLPFLRRR